MFGEGRLNKVHRVGGDLRVTGQRLTGEKLSLREVKQFAKVTQPVTGRAGIHTQMDFTSKPFVLCQASKGLNFHP